MAAAPDGSRELEAWSVAERGAATTMLSESCDRLHAALGLAEELLALALDRPGCGGWWSDLTPWIHCSPNVAALFGFPASVAWISTEQMDERVHPEDRERLARARAAWAGGADGAGVEHRVVWVDGSVHWLYQRARLQKRRDGRGPSLVGFVQDITDGRLGERPRRESDERLKTFAELGSDWYWEQDAELRFVEMSGGFEVRSGIPLAACLGRGRWEIPGTANTPEEQEQLAGVLARREPFRDVVVRRYGPDGRLQSHLVSGVPMFDDNGRFRGYRGIGKDVTAQSEAEAKLKESEAQFRTLTELSSDWYWEQEEEFRFTFVSERAFGMLGRGADYVIGKRRWELPTVEIAGGWEAHQAVLAAHQPFRDLVLQRLDAQHRLHVLSVSGTPIFDAGGRFRGYRGVARDITEQITAAEALKESERRVRLATECADIGIWERDLATEVIRWSPNIGAFFGRPDKTTTTPEEFRSFVHPEDLPRLLTARAAWLAGGSSFEIEHRIVLPDGAVRWVHQRGAIDRGSDRRPLRTLGIVQDITNRKQAEFALRESEEKFRLLAENMRDVFWISDPGLTHFQYVSRSYERIWGRQRESLYADAQGWRESVLPEYEPAIERAIERQKRREAVELEFRIRRPDADERWLVARSTPMINSRGEQLACGIVEDITERKLQEQRRLNEALRQRDTLVREVHHRIKNNLQGVVGLLRRHASRNGTMDSMLEAAITQVQTVALVHGLHGQRGVEGLALHEIVRAIARMLETLNGARILLEDRGSMQQPALLLEGEAVAVALVINELVNNAVKHATRSGASTATTMRLRRNGDHACISVRNCGRLPVGFDFEAGRGIGTGLSLVRALLPSEGAALKFRQVGEAVEVELDLLSPVVLSSSKQISTRTAHVRISESGAG